MPAEKIRLPPQNLEAERCVLGCQLLDQRCIPAVRELISPAEFYADTNAAVQRAINKLYDSGGAIDSVTVTEQLIAQRELDDVGGVHTVLELLEVVPHSAHAVHYARMVLKCAKRRRAITIAQTLMEKSYDASVDDVEATQAAIRAVEQLAESDEGLGFFEMSALIDDLINSLEAGVQQSVSVMIPKVDELTRGLAFGEMVIVAARPSHGKTLMALQSIDAATRHYPGLIISKEMAKELLAVRALSAITEVSGEKWMQATDRLRHDRAAYYLGRQPLVVADKCDNVLAAEMLIARAVKKFGVRVVAVDYAQLLPGEGSSDTERISDVSRRMKNAANKHNVILLLLSQLNREIESRRPAEPYLSDLKGSGSLEQDCDVALFPFWPRQMDDKFPDPREYHIYQRKNRNRGISADLAKMTIEPQRQRLVEYRQTKKDDDFYIPPEAQDW